MSEHWYRDVVEMSQDAIYVWCDGRFVFANRASARLFGVEAPEQLVGRIVYEFVHPDYVSTAKQRMQTLLDGGGPLPPQEFKMLRVDGGIVDVEAMATLFRFQDRPAAHVILRDIAERKALQNDQMQRLRNDAEHRRVQAERDYFLQLFETSPNLAWTARPDGNIDFANRRLLQCLDLGIEDVSGSNWQSFVHPDDLPEILTRWKRSLESGEPYEAELRLRAKSSLEYRWHLSRSLPVRDGAGEIQRWVGTTTDIHDQKEARAVLEQSQLRLAEAVRLRTEDLLNANTALRDEIEERKHVEKALRGSREKLRKLSAHLQSARESERAAVAREIHDELGATLTAAKMDLHWFAKTLADNQVPRGDKLREAVELVDSAIQTVKRIATELRPSILDHLGLWAALQWQLQEFELNFNIPCQIDPAPDGIVLANDAQTAVFRIFQEALTNIARHAKASRVKVELRPDRAGIMLGIQDNGIGLPPGKIVEPDACGIQGMRERARSFGGDVRFEQTAGGGTTVLVKFPARVKSVKRMKRDREAV
ncbi:MAG TPA: PAS domain S-box protein [Burkholderiales bacterium]|nr:PAS domain S-box protein [Burkholderiales bacterium]